MPAVALAVLLAAQGSGPFAEVHKRFDANESKQLVPLLSEVLRFPTVKGNTAARDAEQAWLRRTALQLGLVPREADLVTEVELPGPAGAPVLGLVVHGDVQPVEEKKWALPPFAGEVREGRVLGRGAADDKGPLVQALLAMSALRASGLARTHTVRLIVGSDEESDNLDIKTYLESHAPPAFSLVLDSDFPVTVGEKAWNALAVTAVPEPKPRAGAEKFPYLIESIEAGLHPSIVPDAATVVLRWREGPPQWAALSARLQAKKPDAGTTMALREEGPRLTVSTRGRSAHSGVNIEGGRNALVSLARLVAGELPPSPQDDLLAFARLAGADLQCGGLGLTESVPLWGRYSCNVATISKKELFPAGGLATEDTLTINLRRPPPLSGPELQWRMDKLVAGFDARTGAHLLAGGFYGDEPLAFDPQAKIVQRLMKDYRNATGRKDPPAISGGGTYAKRLPNAIAFGMWFPDKPYTGHDVDEFNPVADLQLGAHALIEALADLATSLPLSDPFQP